MAETDAHMKPASLADMIMANKGVDAKIDAKKKSCKKTRADALASRPQQRYRPREWRHQH